MKSPEIYNQTFENQIEGQSVTRTENFITKTKQVIGRLCLTTSLMIGSGAVVGVGHEVYEAPESPAEAAPDPNDPMGYPYPSGVTHECRGGAPDWCLGDVLTRPGGYDYSNCTDYVDWVLENYMGVNLTGMGNGKDWVRNARAKGYTVDSKPEPGDIYSTGTTGFGHVGMVEKVNSDGSVNTINYNGYTGRFYRGYNKRYSEYADINGTGVHWSPGGTTVPAAQPQIGADYYLNWDNDSLAEKSFGFGRSTDQHMVGDWDGDNRDEIGLRRGTTYYFDFGLDGNQNQSFSIGRDTDKVFIGDWDGDGKDDLGLRRGATYFLLDHDGSVDKTVSWGNSTDKLLVGDWDGNGKDDLGLWRPSNLTAYLDYNNNGIQNASVTWGRTGDKPIIGDWDEDGKDELGLWRSSNHTFYLDFNNNGKSEKVITFGRSTDIPIIGDFNDDGRDDVGLRRGATYYFNWDNDNPVEKTIGFGRSTDKHFIGDWYGNGDNPGVRR